MSDLIDRRAAIDVVKGIDSHFVKYIEALPSSQPELSDEEKHLIKQLRSYHNGSYAAVLDKLMAPRVADAVDTGREEGGE